VATLTLGQEKGSRKEKFLAAASLNDSPKAGHKIKFKLVVANPF
jgi:hypothetical protein